MWSHAGRRLLQLIPTVLGVVLLTFLILRAVPGDATTMAGGQATSEEVRRRLAAQWGLDQPWPVQLWRYLKGLPFLDLGASRRDGTPVRDLLALHFARTFQLGACAFVVAVAAGLSLGVAAALRRDTIVDRLVLGLSLAGASTPAFVSGVLLMLLASACGWRFISATTMDLRDPLLGGWRGWSVAHLGIDPPYIILPALTLGSRSVGYLARTARLAVIEASFADHLRTAKAKGLGPAKVLLKHQLKNAMIPITTVVGLSLADFLTGAIIVEAVFQWPGLGFLIREAIGYRDAPVIMGTVLFMTLVFVATNFVVDTLYAWLDPRARAA